VLAGRLVLVTGAAMPLDLWWRTNSNQILKCQGRGEPHCQLQIPFHDMQLFQAFRSCGGLTPMSR
jgi:hypothetical protein